MSDPTPSRSTPLCISLRLTFLVSSITIITLPYIFTNPTAGSLRRVLVALTPILLVPLSIVLHVLASWENNPHLQLGLIAFFVGVLNSIKYLGYVPFKAWFETWTSTILGTVAAPPFAIAAFVVSELLYYGLVWVFYGWHHLGTYKAFHDRLHTHFRKMGHGAVETTKDGITNGLANVYDLVSLCFSTSQVEDAREDPDQIDNQARLPPPYWMNMQPLTPTTGSSSNSDLKLQDTLILDLE